MIDYDKLKEAHNLADKLAKADKQAVSIGIQFYSKEPGYFLQRFGIEEQPIYESLDSLIEALKELTRPEPKYAEGDYIWMVINDLPHGEKVESVEVLEHQIYYNNDRLEDDDLYPSRQALIESQIEYWKEMLSQELEQEYSYEYICLNCRKRFSDCRCVEFKAFKNCDPGHDPDDLMRQESKKYAED